MIGIVSHDQDLHAAVVRDHLARMGADVAVLDTAAFPAGLALTVRQDGLAWSAEWGSGGLDLGELRAMWWRRPQPFALHPAVTDPQDRLFALGECAAAVGGVWPCLDAVWVNDPVRDEAASRKVWQLRLAAGLGLRVPRTCITNDPDVARAFIDGEPGRVVFKPFGGTPATWRETRPIRAVDLDLLDHVRTAPVIFQEAIPGGRDVRVTIVGRQVFAAEIRASATGSEFDFRLDAANSPTEACELPSVVRAQLLALMDRLGLHYGAIDLRRAPDGDLVFLEINPAGQWLFVEYATGQDISGALAGHLVALDRAGAPVRAPRVSSGAAAAG